MGTSIYTNATYEDLTIHLGSVRTLGDVQHRSESTYPSPLPLDRKSIYEYGNTIDLTGSTATQLLDFMVSKRCAPVCRQSPMPTYEARSSVRLQLLEFASASDSVHME